MFQLTSGMWWGVVSALNWLCRAVAASGLPYYEPRFVSGLRPRTVELYRQQVSLFIQWADYHRWHICFPAELDQALIQYALATLISKAHFERLLSAVGAVCPQVRGNLPPQPSFYEELASSPTYATCQPYTLGRSRGYRDTLESLRAGS